MLNATDLVLNRHMTKSDHEERSKREGNKQIVGIGGSSADKRELGTLCKQHTRSETIIQGQNYRVTKLLAIGQLLGGKKEYESLKILRRRPAASSAQSFMFILPIRHTRSATVGA